MLPKFADRSTEIEFDVGMSADTMRSMGSRIYRPFLT